MSGLSPLHRAWLTAITGIQPTLTFGVGLGLAQAKTPFSGSLPNGIQFVGARYPSINWTHEDDDAWLHARNEGLMTS